jgi:uncharacterized membrane protein
VAPADPGPPAPVDNGMPAPGRPCLRQPGDRTGSAAVVVVRCGTGPLVACGRYHAGRSAVFSSDCAPHLARPDFLDLPGYQMLWPKLAGLLASAD